MNIRKNPYISYAIELLNEGHHMETVTEELEDMFCITQGEAINAVDAAAIQIEQKTLVDYLEVNFDLVYWSSYSIAICHKLVSEFNCSFAMAEKAFDVWADYSTLV